MKHPLDWRDQKKTPHTVYCLAISRAWHARNLDPDGYSGPVVDPLGDETAAMSEQDYDAMVAAGHELLKAVRESAAKLPIPVAAKHVRVLVHPDAHHAVVVRLPHGGDAMAVVREQREAPDGGEDAARTYSFSSRMLWPPDGSAGRSDLMDSFSLAFHMIYPVEYLKLAGWRGTEVKKRA